MTRGQKHFFTENGYLAVQDLVSSHLIDKMKKRIEELCDAWDSEEARRVGVQQEDEIEGALATVRTEMTVRKFSNLIRYEPVFEEHAQNPDFLDVVEDLIGTPISLFADQALLKPPLVGAEKMPHQDNAYFNVEPADAVVTCWCALDDATVANGCMHYIPGSHDSGLVGHSKIPGTPHLVPEGFDKEKAVPVPLEAGGVIFHHALTQHFSPDNKTAQWRRAFVVHLVRSDAKSPLKDPKELPRLR